MSPIYDFTLWFFRNIPTLLMAEPICYFIGLCFSFAIIALVYRLMHLGR